MITWRLSFHNADGDIWQSASVFASEQEAWERSEMVSSCLRLGYEEIATLVNAESGERRDAAQVLTADSEPVFSSGS